MSEAGLDMKMMLDVMQEGTGTSWMANSLRRRIESGTRMQFRAIPLSAQSPPAFINKDLLEQLDAEKLYDTYTKLMKGE